MAGRVLTGVVATALLVALFALWVDMRAARRDAEASATWPPRGQILDIGGTEIHVEIAGTGPDLILLHGAGGSAREVLHGLGATLQGDFRVIAFDRPGLGHSEALHDRGESPREQARVLIRAAAELGIRRPVVAGHSYGGAVALAWALEAPGDTAALVLISGTALPWPGELDAFYRYLGSGFGQRVLIPLISAFLPPARLDASLVTIFRPQAPPAGYSAATGAPLAIRRATMRQNVLQITALRAHLEEMSTQYRSIDMPVEILHGSDDDTVPLAVHAEPLADLIEDARLVQLDGMGHMPHQVAPDEVAEAIRRAATRAGLRLRQ